jgi:tRNA G18 (ribose-2'-O)-methylase SpoU
MRTRDAQFQQWQALLTNRTKRHRTGSFLVQGVRPITMAVQCGWTIRALLYDEDRRLSRWASDLLATVPGTPMAGELLAELGEASEAPELVAVVATRPDDLARIPLAVEAPLVVALDRPNNPGNLGTIVRSADAFGAAGVVVCGHSTDVYDPRTVRASTGSLFSVPVVRAEAPEPVLAHFAGLTVVGTDESGTVDVADADLSGPTLLLVGNETTGLSATWRSACDVVVRIPIGGGASSLNAATAAGIVLYEARRPH